MPKVSEGQKRPLEVSIGTVHDRDIKAHPMLWTLDGKPYYVGTREGKEFIVWGEEEGKPYDYIDDEEPFLLGGKLCYVADQTNSDGSGGLVKRIVVWGGEELPAFDYFSWSGPIVAIGQKPCYAGKLPGQDGWAVAWHTELGPTYDSIDNNSIVAIGGRPCYVAEHAGKKFVVWWNKGERGPYDNVQTPIINIAGRPCYVADRSGQKFIVWDTIEEKPADDIWELTNSGGMPCYIAVNNRPDEVDTRTKQPVRDLFLVWGAHWMGPYVALLSTSHEDEKRSRLTIVGGRPTCVAVGHDHQHVILWGSDATQPFDDVFELPIIQGGRPCYYGRRDGKHFVIWGTEELGPYDDAITEFKPSRVLVQRDGKLFRLEFKRV